MYLVGIKLGMRLKQTSCFPASVCPPQELLEDPSVVVRGATVVGVSQILSLYWEMIPGSVIKSLLGRMVQDLAWDASAISVRVAVIQVSGVCPQTAVHVS